MMTSTQATKAKKEAQKALSEMITNESPVADVSLTSLGLCAYCQYSGAFISLSPFQSQGHSCPLSFGSELLTYLVICSSVFMTTVCVFLHWLDNVKTDN